MIHSLFIDSDKNEDLLMVDLKLRRDGRTIVFTDNNIFVLSPYVGENKDFFDISEANINKFKRGEFKGYLLIRYKDEYLISNLQEFMNQLTDDTSKTPYDKYATNKQYRWKFKIIKDGCYQIQRIKSKKLMPIRLVSREEVIKVIGNN